MSRRLEAPASVSLGTPGRRASLLRLARDARIVPVSEALHELAQCGRGLAAVDRSRAGEERVKAAARALSDNPSWSRMPRHWIKVALWAHGYSEDVPDRNDIARALTASKHGGARAPERKEVA